MIGLILVELGVIVAASLAFIAVLGNPSQYGDPVIAWHLWSFAVLTVFAEGSLMLLGLGVRVPSWMFVVVFGGQAGVALWRLWLAVRGRRAAVRGGGCGV